MQVRLKFYGMLAGVVNAGAVEARHNAASRQHLHALPLLVEDTEALLLVMEKPGVTARGRAHRAVLHPVAGREGGERLAQVVVEMQHKTTRER